MPDDGEVTVEDLRRKDQVGAPARVEALRRRQPSQVAHDSLVSSPCFSRAFLICKRKNKDLKQNHQEHEENSSLFAKNLVEQ
jgi:hypothetical protein